MKLKELIRIIREELDDLSTPLKDGLLEYAEKIQINKLLAENFYKYNEGLISEELYIKEWKRLSALLGEQ